jgi:hypothetical protein
LSWLHLLCDRVLSCLEPFVSYENIFANSTVYKFWSFHWMEEQQLSLQTQSWITIIAQFLSLKFLKLPHRKSLKFLTMEEEITADENMYLFFFLMNIMAFSLPKHVANLNYIFL